MLIFVILGRLQYSIKKCKFQKHVLIFYFFSTVVAGSLQGAQTNSLGVDFLSFPLFFNTKAGLGDEFFSLGWTCMGAPPSCLVANGITPEGKCSTRSRADWLHVSYHLTGVNYSLKMHLLVR